MNSVHEPGPNGDSETILSRKIRSKTKLGARAPKLAQLGTPGAPRVHQWPCRGRHSRPYRGRGQVVSWPRPWPCRSLSCRIVASLSRVPLPPVAPRHPAPPRPSASALACAVSWACVRAGTAVSWPALRHNPSLLTIQVGQLYCNTLQPPAG